MTPNSIGSVIVRAALGGLVYVLGAVVFSWAGAAEENAESILRAMAEDYRHDPTAQTIEIGFLVDNEKFHMAVRRNRESGPHDISFNTGFPDHPIAYWELSKETLVRLNNGMTGETATARARADDPRLMFMDATENFPRFLWSGTFWTQMMEFKVHFFAGGLPEIIPLAPEHTVESHGQRVVGIHYAPRLSVFWTYVEPEAWVNEEEDLDANPFETIYIATKGRIKAVIGGNESLLEAGNVMFIPKDVTHVFSNPFDEPMEGIMILFGDGLNEF